MQITIQRSSSLGLHDHSSLPPTVPPFLLSNLTATLSLDDRFVLELDSSYSRPAPPFISVAADWKEIRRPKKEEGVEAGDRGRKEEERRRRKERKGEAGGRRSKEEGKAKEKGKEEEEVKEKGRSRSARDEDAGRGSQGRRRREGRGMGVFGWMRWRRKNGERIGQGRGEENEERGGLGKKKGR